MLSTGLSTPLAAGIAIFCAICVLFAVYVYRWMWKLAEYCRGAVSFVQNQNKNSVSLRRIAEVETQLTELLDSYDALLRSHKKLRARIGMREVRKSRENGVDLDERAAPAGEAERAAYKSKLREKLRKEGRL